MNPLACVPFEAFEPDPSRRRCLAGLAGLAGTALCPVALAARAALPPDDRKLALVLSLIHI